MPANKKYLSSNWQRAAKISAAVLGGYIVTVTLHLAWGVLVKDKSVMLLTTAFSGFFLWVAIMVFAFISKNGWKFWAILLGIILVCLLIIYCFK
ncbi:MAG: hypothetical protein ACK5NB_00975 [Flavobacteriaceae bacterium]